MGRKILPFGELIKAYKDKRTNPEANNIISEATNKLLALPKV